MKIKKMLALLLTLCMIFSIMAPAANAVQKNSASAVQQSGNKVGGSSLGEWVPQKGNSSLRDDQSGVINRENLSYANGKWTATAADGTTVDLTDAQLPEDIRALREVASQYSTEDMVYVFITMEAAPAAELYSSIRDVPAQLTQQLLLQQDNMIASIEKNVLRNEELNVVSQFTYLTNSIVVETQFGNLEAIAAMPGVKSVFISPVYYPCEVSDSYAPMTNSSTQMTGVASVWEQLGYTGQGMTIAILDTGLDLDHPSFAADPAGAAWDVAWVQEMMDTYDLYAEQSKLVTNAASLYYSAKVPFRFNYAMGNTNVSHDAQNGDHGSHVAGISAANKVEGTSVVGMAPDAQIIVMKVFGPNGGAAMYDILMALEDCMTMGVDVVNMSLGSPAGFSVTEIAEIDDIYNRITETDIIVDIAAGNEGTSSQGSNWGYNMQLTDHIDNATMSSPATYANAMAVGSVDNNLVAADFFELADGTKVFYQHSMEVYYGYTTATLDTLAYAGELEYVIIDGLGVVEDFYDAEYNSLVEGKIAVIPRGDLSFAEKAFNAQDAGAAAVLIWNNQEGDIFSFGMSTSLQDAAGNILDIPYIPVVLISVEDGQLMADAEAKNLTVSEEYAFRTDPNGGQMSSFSSWGVAPDLRLLPDISGIGGNVLSCYDNGQYGLMSGTSMATPQVAGVTALVLQYLRETFPDATEAEIRTLVDALMMSTAVPVVDLDSGVEASPRQQGAGLVNALGAVTAKAYLSVAGSDRPKAELKDSADGKFSFTFTVHNYSETEKTYTLRSSLLAEDYMMDEEYPGQYFLAEQDKALDNSAVTFSKNTVTVAAGESVEVTVTIELTAADKEWIDTYFPSGNYIEGFVYLENEDEVTLSLPFLGFYGSWDAAPLFDTGFWYDEGFWGSSYEGIEQDGVEANLYYHVLWTELPGADWVLGMNPYVGVQVDENGNVIYSTNNNVLSPNGDGALDKIEEFYLSLMRNAEDLSIIYYDEDGQIVDRFLMGKESKTMYLSSYGQVVPFIYSWYYGEYPLYDFSNLEDGDVVYLTISGAIDYEGAEVDVLFDKMPIHIDTTAPVLDTESIVEISDETGNYITLTFADAHPAAVIVMNTSGTQIYDYYDDLVMQDNGDGTYTVTVDVTDLGDPFTGAICDYGCNEATYTLTWSEPGANNPEVDMSALYAYQVGHEVIYNTMGYDAMFGWVTIDKQTAVTQMLNSDMYEYYALTAAEYVDGYVFAVDAGYNLLYMVPGIWSRNVIANLDMNVLDMAFDDVNGVMYVTGSAMADSYYGPYETYVLATVDLLTGDVQWLMEYYDNYEMPWSMTFVGDKLYAIKQGSSSLYEIELEEETYEMLPVVDGEENPIVITDADGREVSPNYAQSMTYSETDGVIYWAYYQYSYRGAAYDLITIDPTDWSHTAVAMECDSEYVGLLMLDSTYELPESTEVSKVVMTKEQTILSSGQKEALIANALPWNLPEEMRVLSWTSSNEDVATVDANGVVTAVAEGVAIITASCDGFEASCEVIVVDIAGHLNAYKYFDGNYDSGYWLDIDLAAGTEKGTVASPVDFAAADYNGHTGLVYGYDINGQCYWFDPVKGTHGALGMANPSLSPVDMAYDYATGMMYVLTLNQMTGENTLYALNMTTGALLEIATSYYGFMTLACSSYGILYAIDYEGILYELWLVEDDGMGGGGIAPWSTAYAVGDGVTNYMIDPIPLAETPIYGMGQLQYLQSMCYDHNNDVLLWVNPETSRIYWIDGLYSDDGVVFCVDLGDPSGTGLIEYTGTHVVPAQIPELEPQLITDVVAEDMMVLLGGAKPAEVNIYPFNATAQTVASWESSDPSVAYVDENGMVVGVSLGTATITATVIDIDGYEFVVEFNVGVKKSTGNLYTYLMYDTANYDGYSWIEINDADPKNYELLTYAEYNGAYMTLYAAEYVDGLIYAYGYDDMNWEANFQFFTIDPENFQIIDAIDMGSEFPFVYDMAFDYTTGAMLALAGSQTSTNLYYVNLTNGELVECVLLDERLFLSLAVDANGTVYAIECSAEEMDWETYTTVYATALMYTVDIETGACEPFLDTGVVFNQVGSMTYDYDTGYIYWGSMNSNYQGALQLIDLEEKVVYSLGGIGATASQITGLISFAEAYPEVPEELSKLVITSTMVEIREGNTVALDIMVLPATIDAELTWTSDNEAVATVDENGVVTGVSEGVAIITASAENGLSASCKIVVHGDTGYFITYNRTDGGFSAIYRPDPTVEINLTEGETEPSVTAMEMVNGYIYAYTERGDLFVTSEKDGFERTYLGNCGIEVEEPFEDVWVDAIDYYYPNFVVRDMAWDPVNERMLAVGCYGVYIITEFIEDGYSEIVYMEYDSGCGLYEVDLSTGEMTLLCNIGTEDAPETGVHMLEVTDDGKVFVYSTFMDWVSVLDTETGALTNVATLQNQGVYGSSDGDLMAMTYDAETELIYMLFTSNGVYYQLFTLNVNTGAMSRVDYVGDVIYDEDSWSYIADAYAGFVVNEEHVCRYTEEVDRQDPTWSEPGYIAYQCMCGEIEYEEIPAVATALDETIAELEEAIAAGDQELADEIAAVNTALQELMDAYKRADAALKAELAAQIASANASMQAMVSKLTADLAAAEQELADAIAAGDKALEDKIAEMNAALEAAIAVSNAAEEAMQAQINAAVAELEAAIAAGDKALSDKIAALEEAIAAANAANEATKAELNKAVTDAVATANAAAAQVQKNLDAAKAELTAKDNELAAQNDELAAQAAQLNKLVTVAIIIACIAACGCVALLALKLIDKRKKA